ncbi:ComEC/Rec2 family competence protein, partial [Staphylococcus caprae]
LKFFNTFIPASSDKNEQSIITLIQYRNKNILLMGDATKNNESILLQNYKLPKIDILKVGHHGSRTSSSEEFVKNIQPKISLISSGKHNKYHLPNDDVISRLKENGSEVYDTQDNGELSINLDDIKTKIQRIYQRQSTNAREVTQ